MIRINYEDPNRTDGTFDVNGNLIRLYKGEPFTGIVEHYDVGILVGAYEFKVAINGPYKKTTILMGHRRRSGQSETAE